MRYFFTPIEVALLSKVVDQTCAELGTNDEANREAIAAKVMASYAQGQVDFDTLLAAGFKGSSEASHAA